MLFKGKFGICKVFDVQYINLICTGEVRVGEMFWPIGEVMRVNVYSQDEDGALGQMVFPYASVISREGLGIHYSIVTSFIMYESVDQFAFLCPFLPDIAS